MTLDLCNLCHENPKQQPLGWCSPCLGEAQKMLPRSRIQIELVGEPKGKGRPRFTRRGPHGAGIAYTPEKTRSYEAALRMAAQDAMAGKPPLEGALALSVEAYVPIPTSWSKKKQLQAAMMMLRPTTRPDFDNYLKTLDALNEIVWRDDAQVVSQTFGKFYSERPRLVVTVEAIGHATQTATA